MTLGRLFLLFVLVPLADLTLLVWAGGQMGFLPTVALVVLTAAVGSWLARREGTAAWRRVQTRMASGGLPGPELLDGLVILVAGVLLLTPGFLTDVVGLLGLIPPSRAVLRRAMAARLKRSMEQGTIRMASFGPMSPMGPGFGPSTGFGPIPSEPGVEDAEVVEETSRPLRRDETPA
ncbi:MAG: FxsA family protein [Bacteroidota bacterium]